MCYNDYKKTQRLRRVSSCFVRGCGKAAADWQKQPFNTVTLYGRPDREWEPEVRTSAVEEEMLKEDCYHEKTAHAAAEACLAGDLPGRAFPESAFLDFDFCHYSAVM